MCTEDKHLIDIEKLGINSKNSETRSKKKLFISKYGDQERYHFFINAFCMNEQMNLDENEPLVAIQLYMGLVNKK